jgi:hypothetical protein
MGIRGKKGKRQGIFSVRLTAQLFHNPSTMSFSRRDRLQPAHDTSFDICAGQTPFRNTIHAYQLIYTQNASIPHVAAPWTICIT